MLGLGIVWSPNEADGEQAREKNPRIKVVAQILKMRGSRRSSRSLGRRNEKIYLHDSSSSRKLLLRWFVAWAKLDRLWNMIARVQSSWGICGCL